MATIEKLITARRKLERETGLFIINEIEAGRSVEIVKKFLCEGVNMRSLVSLSSASRDRRMKVLDLLC